MNAAATDPAVAAATFVLLILELRLGWLRRFLRLNLQVVNVGEAQVET